VDITLLSSPLIIEDLCVVDIVFDCPVEIDEQLELPIVLREPPDMMPLPQTTLQRPERITPFIAPEIVLEAPARIEEKLEPPHIIPPDPPTIELWSV
jgi:hypothetical protein